MTQNTITLAEVPNFPIGKLSALSPEQLLFLQEEAEKNLKRAKILKDWLDSSIALKYREISANIRNLDSKDSGTIHFTDGTYKITSVIAKKIEWDQQKLKDVVSAIKTHGDNPDVFGLHYSKTSYVGNAVRAYDLETILEALPKKIIVDFGIEAYLQINFNYNFDEEYTASMFYGGYGKVKNPMRKRARMELLPFYVINQIFVQTSLADTAARLLLLLVEKGLLTFKK